MNTYVLKIIPSIGDYMILELRNIIALLPLLESTNSKLIDSITPLFFNDIRYHMCTSVSNIIRLFIIHENSVVRYNNDH